jgi:ATP-dependent DNA helicase RecQ
VVSPPSPAVGTEWQPPSQPSAAAVAAAREVFGLPGLRPGQAEAVAAAEAGRDVLFVAPTGAGKSIAYWVPALAGSGLAIVVSPLIALMTDQVARLRRAGVAAAAMHSQLAAEAQRETLRAARRGELRFLYVAPERFASAAFQETLGELRVDRFVVDEAHCISSWGHDFRQDYRRLAEAIAACGRPPVTAVTATATPRVRADISTNLELRDACVVVSGFVRPELDLVVSPCRRGHKEDAIMAALSEMPGRAIVYCGRTRDCDETAEALGRAGIAAAAYHGGLEGDERQRVQAAFTAGWLRVVVATSAFGMGVDIPDIRQVIHRDFPSSLETYYQEAGRAGRDGQRARCLLLYSPADRDLQEFFIEQAYPDRAVVRAVYRALLRSGRWDVPEAGLTAGIEAHQVEAAKRLLEGAGALLASGAVRRLTAPPVDFDERERLKEAAYARLTQMMAYAATAECRHARIADYFGEAGAARSCASCDNCRSPRAPDVPVEEEMARAALQAVARFDGHLGASRIGALLRGVDDAWVRGHPWARELGFFAALPSWSEGAVRALLEALVERGLVRRGHGERPTLGLSPEGRQALRGGGGLALAVPATVGLSLRRASGSGAGGGASAGKTQRGGAWPGAAPPGGPPAESAQPGGGWAGPAQPGGAGPQDAGAEVRFQRLRAWRLEVARGEGRPAFTIFDDRTLREIAAARPASLPHLLAVHGVGPAKLSRYGAAVLEVLRSG